MVGGGVGGPVEGYGINSLFPLYNRSCIILSTKVVFFARASSDNKMFVSLLAATWQKQDLFSLSIIVISKLSKEIRTRAKHCKQGFDLNLGAAICFARVPAVMSDLTSCAHTYLPWGGKLSRQSLGQNVVRSVSEFKLKGKTKNKAFGFLTCLLVPFGWQSPPPATSLSRQLKSWARKLPLTV